MGCVNPQYKPNNPGTTKPQTQQTNPPNTDVTIDKTDPSSPAKHQNYSLDLKSLEQKFKDPPKMSEIQALPAQTNPVSGINNPSLTGGNSQISKAEGLLESNTHQPSAVVVSFISGPDIKNNSAVQIPKDPKEHPSHKENEAIDAQDLVHDENEAKIQCLVGNVGLSVILKQQ